MYNVYYKMMMLVILVYLQYTYTISLEGTKTVCAISKPTKQSLACTI